MKHALLLIVGILAGSASLEANAGDRLAWIMFFGSGSTELSQPALDSIHEFVAGQAQSIPRECPVGALVVGHVDGAEAANGRDALGLSRAETVAREIERSGWPFGAIERQSQRETRPLYKTEPTASEPQNRRVEVIPVYRMADGELECQTHPHDNGQAGVPIDYSCQVVLKSGVRCPFESGSVRPLGSPDS